MNHYGWADLHVGLSAEFEVTIHSAMLDAFRDLSGDSNPLHCDPEAAKARGFAGVVVHGMLVSSFYSQLVGVHLPGESCLLHGIDIAFSKPVYVGDRLSVRGEITHLTDAYRQAEIRASIQSPAGVVSKAKIRVGVHG